MAEAILSATAVDTDVLSPALSYGLNPSGSWCLTKREATVFALGSSYSPTSVKMISIPFGSSNEWLVPESVVFTAIFENTHGSLEAWPATPDANCLFERIDVRLAGQLIESVSESNRVNELFTRLTMSSDKKRQAAQMGFGTAVTNVAPEWDAAQKHFANKIPHSAKKKIMWKVNVSGLLAQHRWIPLYALSGLGLVINFYLAPANQSLISKAPVVDTTEYSQQYLLSDVRALCTMQTISDELMEGFMSQLVQGSALRIPIKKLESIWSYIPTNTASRFDVPMSRTYTRLCSLFASFVREGLTEATDVLTNGEGRNKLCNSFYTHTLSAETLSYSLQLGTRRVPDNNAVGFAEHWHRLMNCVGLGSSLAHSTGITYEDYSNHSYAIGICTEKIPHLASTGENLSNTSTIHLKLEGFGTTVAHLPTRCHLVAQTDAILEIRDTTVELFE